jgi:hypothetical protein
MTNSEKALAAKKIMEHYLRSPKVQALVCEVTEVMLIYGEEEGVKLMELRLKEMDYDNII